MPRLPLIGGCMCGALRYEVNAPPIMIYNCHCTNCRKISGSAFNISMTAMEASVSFTKGAPALVEWISDAGSTRTGLFCGACGSRIANGMSPTNGVLSLRAGTLDDMSWVKPVGDIWTKSALPWVRFIDGGIQAERQPKDYAPFVEAFRKQALFQTS